MKNSVIITLFLLIFSSSIVNAQDYTTGQIKYKDFIGLGAGFTTGFGISYRHIPDNFGVMINFAPYYDKNNSSLVSAGLAFLQKIKEAPDHRVFVYFANSILYQKTYSSGYSNSYPYNYTTTITQSDVYNTGLGLDFEFFNPLSPFVFDLMGGLGAYDSFSRVTFTAEFAIYYEL